MKIQIAERFTEMKPIKAMLIRDSGETLPVKLPRALPGRIEKLHQLVGQTLESVALGKGLFMLVDEEGKLRPHVINSLATAIAHDRRAICPEDYIAGNAILVPEEAVR